MLFYMPYNELLNYKEGVMGLTAGIIGLPNVGKSTIFNALCKGSAAAENYPFCTIDPNNGIVAIPDDRLRRMTTYLETKKVVPTFLELVDIAGLVKGASKGEGLGNQFLGHVKNVNALVHVVRCFTDEDVSHVHGQCDSISDVEVVQTELILKDLETVQRGIERMEKVSKSGEKEAKSKLELFKKAHSELSKGNNLREIFTDNNSQSWLEELHLLTMKDILYVANVDEEALQMDAEQVLSIEKFAQDQGAQCIRICGKIEAEIAELPQEDRQEFLESLGLSQSGLHVLAVSMYSLLGLRTFFTHNENENRAWTIKAGTHAQSAAGVIHTDFEKGFIKAEVYELTDLEQYGSEASLRSAGKIRQEGRDYTVQDGDIILFKFNV